MMKRIHEIIDFTNPADRAGRTVALIISVVIVLSILATVLETSGPLYDRWRTSFRDFEFFAIMIFSIEYIVRIWVCTADEKFRHPVFGRLKYALTPLVLIDLIVILPFFLSGLHTNLAFLRVFRFIRLLRLAKLGRYSTALQIFHRVVVRTKEQLTIVLSLLLVMVVVASSLVYSAESSAQPDAFGSIPSAMWWTFCTLTTIGYGDIYPITPMGKLLAACISILGIAMFALPTAILGAAFINEIAVDNSHHDIKVCPFCGKSLDESNSSMR